MTGDKEQSEKLGRKAAGKFIVLDGPDGCGKSTQLRLLADRLTATDVKVLTVRDPGDTAVGDSIRRILLGQDHEDREIHCELMLFMASRAQLVAEKIRPALAAGTTVLADRYVSASCAYQGAGGLAVAEILDIAQFATQKTWPDLTLVLDVPVEVGFARVDARQSGPHDAMERRGLVYHRRVREIFLKLPGIYPRPVAIVDAAGAVQQVHETIVETLAGVDY